MSKYPNEGLTSATTADLVWMSGKWEGQIGSQVIEEHWSDLKGGAFMAMFRWLKEDSVWFYELMTIEQDGEQVMLRVKHFYPGLKGWEEKDESAEFLLVQLQEQEAVFLQVNKPGQWLVYRRETPARLVAYFDNGEGTVKDEDKFVYFLKGNP